MVKANVKIVARWPVKHKDTTDLPEKSVPVSPFSRWLAFFILIPIFLIALVLIIIFFSIFLAFFLIAGIVLSFWIWWLRRQWIRAAPLEGLSDENAVIKEICSVETDRGKKWNQQANKNNRESLCQSNHEPNS